LGREEGPQHLYSPADCHSEELAPGREGQGWEMHHSEKPATLKEGATTGGLGGAGCLQAPSPTAARGATEPRGCRHPGPAPPARRKWKKNSRQF